MGKQGSNYTPHNISFNFIDVRIAEGLSVLAAA